MGDNIVLSPNTVAMRTRFINKLLLMSSSSTSSRLGKGIRPMGACTPKDRYGQEASRFGGSDALWRNYLISEIHPKIDHADVENSLIRSVDDVQLYNCTSSTERIRLFSTSA